MKEELDKIEEALRKYQTLSSFMGDTSVVDEAISAYNRVKPRLEKALKLLEQHELLNSLDDGNSGFIQVGDR